MARRLLLMRHGRTAWNAVGRAQGHADVPLDSTGLDGARAAAAHLATSRDLAALWSSDLLRARQTAACVAEATGLPVKHDERLREFDVGRREGLTLEEFAEQHPDAHAEWLRADRLVPVMGGESGPEVAQRIVPRLQECLTSLHEGETGLAVTHGAALKVGLLGLLRWPESSYRDLGVMENCAWATVTLTGDGRLRLDGYHEKAPRP